MKRIEHSYPPFNEVDMYRVCIISLGCPKNLVDSEVIVGHMVRDGFEIVVEPDGADAVIINTCGFVDSAKEESRRTIDEILGLKRSGRTGKVVVAGCLVQRFKKALEAELSEVDAFLPITDYSGIPDLLRGLGKNRRGGRPRKAETDLGRMLLTQPHVSYLRISEGCNHRCSFCAIPAIRGRLKSKPVDVLVAEAGALAAAGVRELNLVAEDSTDYGRDLEGRALLPELLGELGGVEGLAWIRLLYAYPSRVSDELVKEMARNPKVLSYIDMPIQHMSGRLLKSMVRGTSPALIRRVVDSIRERIPGVILRTSVIVGYPGEEDDDFRMLVDYLQEARFERLGAFAFSPEEGTAAFRLDGRVPRVVAERRLEAVMRLQQAIIEDRNKSLVGTEEEVIVDTIQGDGTILGRTRADAPEIDCAVLMDPHEGLRPGTLIQTRITGHDGYDLLATPLEKTSR
jgi:ribosomal protein S12 methylthiotransferase